MLEARVCMGFLLLDDSAVLVRGLGEVPDEALSAAERGLADATGSDLRRREIRAGRAAARALFARLSPGLARTSVLRDAEGAPRLDPPGEWTVSLAHDREVVAAAAAQGPVGLDVLQESRFAQARTVVEARIERSRAVPLGGAWPEDLPESALLWTAWEALGKLTKKGVLGGAMQVALVARGRPELPLEAHAPGVRVRWWRDEGALVALASVTG